MSVAAHFKLCPESPSYVALVKDGTHITRTAPQGYYVAGVQGVTYLMHRVVYELTHGHCPEVIDHIDGDKQHNLPANLRPADHASNKWNIGMYAHNTSGVKGLSWNSRRGVWVGRVCHRGKVAQKYGASRGEVEQWLLTKRKELHGEYANNG